MERSLNRVLVEGVVTVGFSELTEAMFIIRGKSEGEDMTLRIRVSSEMRSSMMEKIKVGQTVRLVGHLVPAGENRVSIMAECIEIVPVGTGG